ncbi:MAG: 50S ribosomal protein L35 [Epsilonproteobacteria bacterium]|nr:MAG: 50S ribosomal protein L35 [Campylobacteraceae bacterium 4484_166]RLA75720.1 MAG: 50S ribosomal protein L35 [Campylobacterota bacterium]
MPKMKTVSGAKKRFKVKKNGQIKRGSAFRSHILTKMSKKRKRNLRNPKTIDDTNKQAVKRMLCLL